MDEKTELVKEGEYEAPNVVVHVGHLPGRPCTDGCSTEARPSYTRAVQGIEALDAAGAGRIVHGALKAALIADGNGRDARCICAPDPTGARERYAAYGCPVHWPAAPVNGPDTPPRLSLHERTLAARDRQQALHAFTQGFADGADPSRARRRHVVDAATHVYWRAGFDAGKAAATSAENAFALTLGGEL